MHIIAHQNCLRFALNLIIYIYRLALKIEKEKKSLRAGAVYFYSLSMVQNGVFLKGMTGALAPLSYLVLYSHRRL